MLKLGDQMNKDIASHLRIKWLDVSFSFGSVQPFAFVYLLLFTGMFSLFTLSL